MNVEGFSDLIGQVTHAIAGRDADADLEAFLNQRFPATGTLFQDITAACHAAIAAGWMCDREHGGIRFGRVIKPAAGTDGYSVDVVHMNDLAGPYHRHPNGEIDMIMPISPGARFDGHGKGWMVYGSGSEHAPTVTRGEALVLYLLPDGAIEFKPNK